MDELTNEIETALKNGMIDELIETNLKTTNLLDRLTSHINEQDKLLAQWETLNKHLIKTVNKLVSERDTARKVAVHLEQECHSCVDTVHHGNEEQYGTH
jgi:peptidoglycan hydrolase CwlO-like protein